MGNIYNNQGIITQGQQGNNTIIQGQIPRDLEREGPLKAQMLRELPRDKEITVVGILGDTESCSFALQIQAFLKNDGFMVKDGIAESVFAGLPRGLQFNPNTGDFVVDAR